MVDMETTAKLVTLIARARDALKGERIPTKPEKLQVAEHGD